MCSSVLCTFSYNSIIIHKSFSEKLLIKQLLNTAAVTHGKHGDMLFEVLRLFVAALFIVPKGPSGDQLGILQKNNKK